VDHPSGEVVAKGLEPVFVDDHIHDLNRLLVGKERVERQRLGKNGVAAVRTVRIGEPGVSASWPSKSLANAVSAARRTVPANNSNDGRPSGEPPGGKS